MFHRLRHSARSSSRIADLEDTRHGARGKNHVVDAPAGLGIGGLDLLPDPGTAAAQPWKLLGKLPAQTALGIFAPAFAFATRKSPATIALAPDQKNVVAFRHHELRRFRHFNFSPIDSHSHGWAIHRRIGVTGITFWRYPPTHRIDQAHAVPLRASSSKANLMPQSPVLGARRAGQLPRSTAINVRTDRRRSLASIFAWSIA
jgi:hypothetical protein